MQHDNQSRDPDHRRAYHAMERVLDRLPHDPIEIHNELHADSTGCSVGILCSRRLYGVARMNGYLIFYLAGFVIMGALVLGIIRGGRDPESDRISDEEQTRYLRELNHGR